MTTIALLVIMADPVRRNKLRARYGSVPGIVIVDPTTMKQALYGHSVEYIVIDELAGLTEAEKHQVDPLRLWTGGVK